MNRTEADQYIDKYLRQVKKQIKTSIPYITKRSKKCKHCGNIKVNPNVNKDALRDEFHLKHYIATCFEEAAFQ